MCTSNGLEEFWKQVRKDAKRSVGFDLNWVNARNEILQRKHRQTSPAVCSERYEVSGNVMMPASKMALHGRSEMQLATTSSVWN